MKWLASLRRAGRRDAPRDRRAAPGAAAAPLAPSTLAATPAATPPATAPSAPPTFVGAVLPICGLEVLIVAVPPWILTNLHDANLFVAAYHERFRRTIVLVGQDATGAPYFYGPSDLLRALRSLPYELIPWRRYLYRTDPPRSWKLPLPAPAPTSPSRPIARALLPAAVAPAPRAAAVAPAPHAHRAHAPHAVPGAHAVHASSGARAAAPAPRVAAPARTPQATPDPQRAHPARDVLPAAGEGAASPALADTGSTTRELSCSFEPEDLRCGSSSLDLALDRERAPAASHAHLDRAAVETRVLSPRNRGKR